MWVIDQDENPAIQCSCIGLYYEDERNILAIGDDEDHIICRLGTYKTKERATEVLLDIFSAMTKDKEIYRMPKE